MKPPPGSTNGAIDQAALDFGSLVHPPRRVLLENMLGSADVTSWLFEVRDTGATTGYQVVIVASGSLRACETVLAAINAVSTNGETN